MENNQFVQDILRGISTKIREEKNGGWNHQKNIVVILSGKEISDVLKKLRALRRYGIEISVFLTKEVSQTVGKEGIHRILHPRVLIEEGENHDGSSFILDTQVLLVPILSQNTAAKLKHGIHDQGQEQWIWEFLWAKKTVMASAHDLKYPKGIPPKNPFLQHMVQENMDFLKKMGIRFFEEESYYGLLEGLWNEGSEEGGNDGGNKKVITEKDVLGWTQKSEIFLGKGSIITPLARDLAKDKKITFIYP